MSAVDALLQLEPKWKQNRPVNSFNFPKLIKILDLRLFSEQNWYRGSGGKRKSLDASSNPSAKMQRTFLHDSVQQQQIGRNICFFYFIYFILYIFINFLFFFEVFVMMADLKYFKHFFWFFFAFDNGPTFSIEC